MHTMKIKSILFLALMVTTSMTFAQKANLTKAKSSYSKHNDLKSVGGLTLGGSDLPNAKDAIDKAIEHDRTKDLPETWTYYALIYSELALTDSAETAEGYYKTALEARSKAKELDTAGEFDELHASLNTMLAQHELNKGIEAFQEQDFGAAYNAFDKALEYSPGDTTLIFNSAIAANNNNDYKNAVEKYVELVPFDDHSSHNQIMLSIPILYQQLGDTTNALKYSAIAAEKYPNDPNIVRNNILLNLEAGQTESLIGTLNDQIAKNPTEKTYPFYLGIAYSTMEDTDNAIEAYKKALAIDPNYPEVNAELGAAFLNKGIKKYNETNNANLRGAEYEAEIAKAYEIIDQALPYLEKSVELDGTSVSAISNLKLYYTIKEDDAKAEELQKRLDALK